MRNESIEVMLLSSIFFICKLTGIIAEMASLVAEYFPEQDATPNTDTSNSNEIDDCMERHYPEVQFLFLHKTLC